MPSRPLKKNVTMAEKESGDEESQLHTCPNTAAADLGLQVPRQTGALPREIE